MNRRKVLFLLSLIVTCIVIYLLITGSSILVIAVDKNNSIPLGTLITWAGMISLPSAIYWGIGEMRKPSMAFYKLLSLLLKIVLVLGILWVPISYLLAGNLAFQFSEKETFQGGQLAMRWFWLLSYGIAVGTLSVLVLHCLSFLFVKIKSMAAKS